MPAKKRGATPARSKVTVIFPHQLFKQSPALSRERAVILAEDPWFFRRHRFHAQKLVLHRASMRRYRDYLVAEGFTVDYLETAALEKSTDLFQKLAGNGVSEVHMCDPLENGLVDEIEKACTSTGIRLVTYESPMFLCSREYLRGFYPEGRRFYLTEFISSRENTIKSCWKTMVNRLRNAGRLIPSTANRCQRISRFRWSGTPFRTSM